MQLLPLLHKPQAHKLGTQTPYTIFVRYVHLIIQIPSTYIIKISQGKDIGENFAELTWEGVSSGSIYLLQFSGSMLDLLGWFYKTHYLSIIIRKLLWTKQHTSISLGHTELNFGTIVTPVVEIVMSQFCLLQNIQSLNTVILLTMTKYLQK